MVIVVLCIQLPSVCSLAKMNHIFNFWFDCSPAQTLSDLKIFYGNDPIIKNLIYYSSCNISWTKMYEGSWMITSSSTFCSSSTAHVWNLFNLYITVAAVLPLSLSLSLLSSFIPLHVLFIYMSCLVNVLSLSQNTREELEIWWCF